MSAANLWTTQSRIDHKEPRLNQVFLFMYLSSEFKFKFLFMHHIETFGLQSTF